jgi:hypothetical protein
MSFSLQVSECNRHPYRASYQITITYVCSILTHLFPRPIFTRMSIYGEYTSRYRGELGNNLNVYNICMFILPHGKPQKVRTVSSGSTTSQFFKLHTTNKGKVGHILVLV